MSKRLLPLVTLAFISFVSCAAAPLPTYGPSITYTNSSGFRPGRSFLNPERGFYTDINLLEDEHFHWVRREGFSVARAYVRLDNYRDSDLSQDFLDQLNAGLAKLEPAGIKIILRFTYNFPTDSTTPAPDAELATVLRHIQQLEATIRRHSEVIAVVQAGFIGAWGEWHASANDLNNPESEAEILRALLDAVPAERSVQLRYPSDLSRLYPDSLSSDTAFNGSAQARVGHHNDCFVSSRTDVGTYNPEARAEEFKAYLDELTQFVPVGGETCPANRPELRNDCPTTLAELERFHWDFLNHQMRSLTQRWRDDGCWADIAARLGYRYRLLAGQVTPNANAGETITLTLNVSNEGFGKLYNARPVQLILRNVNTGRDYFFRLASDAREVLPLAGEEKQLEFELTLPDLEPGQYNLYLHLPDASETLRDSSRYSIRLANEGLWQDRSGYNALNMTLTVN